MHLWFGSPFHKSKWTISVTARFVTDMSHDHKQNWLNFQKIFVFFFENSSWVRILKNFAYQIPLCNFCLLKIAQARFDSDLSQAPVFPTLWLLFDWLTKWGFKDPCKHILSFCQQLFQDLIRTQIEGQTQKRWHPIEPCTFFKTLSWPHRSRPHTIPHLASLPITLVLVTHWPETLTFCLAGSYWISQLSSWERMEGKGQRLA